MSPSVLVLGASGALGRVTAEEFEKAGWEVFHGARSRLDHERYRHADYDRPETVASAIEGVDLIVNTVDDHALRAEDVVLEHGGMLFNTAAGPLSDTLALRDRAPADARGLVVMHGGLVPGITSLVFMDLLEAHPDADLLEMVWTLTGQGYSGEGGRKWAHSYIAGRAHSPVFRVPLPEPYGERKCMQVAEDERGWLVNLPSTVRVRTGVTFHERDTDAGFRLLNFLWLRRLIPQRSIVNTPKRLTRGGKPGEGTAPPGAVRYWVGAHRDGELIEGRTIEGDDDYLVTVHGTIAVADALVRKVAGSGATGVKSVEELLKLDDVLPRLTELGVDVNAH